MFLRALGEREERVDLRVSQLPLLHQDMLGLAALQLQPRLTDEKKDDETGHAEDSTYRLSGWEELGPKAQPRKSVFWALGFGVEISITHKESCRSLLASLLDHAARVLALQRV